MQLEYGSKRMQSNFQMANRLEQHDLFPARDLERGHSTQSRNKRPIQRKGDKCTEGEGDRETRTNMHMRERAKKRVNFHKDKDPPEISHCSFSALHFTLSSLWLFYCCGESRKNRKKRVMSALLMKWKWAANVLSQDFPIE